MVGKARRNFRKDVRKLAALLHPLPLEILRPLADVVDYFVNRERQFHLSGFVSGFEPNFLRHSSKENFLEFKSVLGAYEERGTTLRLLALLNDALRVANPDCIAVEQADLLCVASKIPD